MPKKKPSRKTPAKDSSKGAKKDKFTLTYWKQISAPDVAFAYQYIEKTKNWNFICRAKKQLTESELGESFAAFVMSNPAMLRPGSTATFDYIDDPVAALKKVVKNPTTEWFATMKQVIDENNASKGAFTPGGVAGFPISSFKPPQAKSPPPGSCPQCHGKGWVCPDHPNLKWEEKVNNECPCWEPEMACPTCNSNCAIILGPGDFSIGMGFCETCQDQRWLCKKHKKPWKLKSVGCDCGPGKPCPDCNPSGHLKLGHLKVIRTGLN